MQNGWNEMELSLDQKKKFVEFINSKWQEPQLCPICNVEQWTIPDYIYQMREIKPPNLERTHVTPIVEIVCVNCGYTIFINAIVAGIYEKEVMSHHEAGSAITKSSATKK